MTTDAIVVEHRRRVLDVYKHFGSEEGHVLNSRHFLAAAQNNRWNVQDFQSGLECAIETGWVEKTPNGWLKLTKSGFQAM